MTTTEVCVSTARYNELIIANHNLSAITDVLKKDDSEYGISLEAGRFILTLLGIEKKKKETGDNE